MCAFTVSPNPQPAPPLLHLILTIGALVVEIPMHAESGNSVTLDCGQYYRKERGKLTGVGWFKVRQL